ncbi:MAG: holo-ACP synthase [Actinomycetota bacterium]|nr:holo-ACP synthase [Actinomycetota bacterium]
MEVERFRRALARTPGLAERLFHEAERADVGRRHNPVEGLAARFAAKEAVMKALGVGLGRFPLRDVEVCRSAAGAPTVRLHGRAAAVAAEHGVAEWRLSLSHTSGLAQAVAVAL